MGLLGIFPLSLPVLNMEEFAYPLKPAVSLRYKNSYLTFSMITENLLFTSTAEDNIFIDVDIMREGGTSALGLLHHLLS